MNEAPKKIWAANQEFAEGIEGPWHVDKSVYGGELYHHDAEVQRLVAEARAEAFEEAANAILSDTGKDEPGYKAWDGERPRICEESAYRRIVALSSAPPRHPEFSVIRHETGNAVEVCGICDIADCRHIRERKAAKLAELALDRDHPFIDTPRQVCPCMMIAQDDSCPVGYPSLLCGVCDGNGITTREKVDALAAEMLKIASDVGEAEDPFAAWEAIAPRQVTPQEAAKVLLDHWYDDKRRASDDLTTELEAMWRRHSLPETGLYYILRALANGGDSDDG